QPECDAHRWQLRPNHGRAASTLYASRSEVHLLGRFMSNVSRRLLFRLGAAAATTRFAAAAPEPSLEQAAGPFNVAEPDLELARLWWSDERNVWTAIGWKDHYFRFNVVYNGTVICEPCPHFAPMRPHA